MLRSQAISIFICCLLGSFLVVVAQDLDSGNNTVTTDKPSTNGSSTKAPTPTDSTNSSSTSDAPSTTKTTDASNSSTTKAPNTTSTPTSSTAKPSSTKTPPASTMAPVKPTSATPNQRFDAASFIGGIVLCGGLIAIVYFGCKFYKARNDRNYHQF